MRKKIYAQIMKDYADARKKNNYILEERKKKLYAVAPRLLEIENELSLVGINISKLLLGHDKNFSLEDLQSKNQSLIAEREKILFELNLPKDFLAVYDCKFCKDTGYVGNEKCSCFKQKLIEKYYAMSNIKDIVMRENFDTFDIRYYKDEKIDGVKSPLDFIKRAMEKSISFVNNFDTQFTNLLFYGNTGLGKTFLCNCIAKEILDKGKTVLYVTAPQLFKILEDIRFGKNKEDFSDEYSKMIFDTDLLIIDDLGSEFSTLPLQSELFNIINTRLVTRKPIIISTNLSTADLENQYSSRIFSRLIGNYVLLKFIGDDIRLLKKNIK